MSEVQEHPAESTALATVKAALPTIIAADNEDILGKLAKELSGFKPDISTEAGRREIASKARKAAVAKMDLIRLAGTLKADHQRVLKGIVAEEKIITERMDGLRDSIRAPLTEFEAREESRVKAHEAALQQLAELGAVPSDATAADIAARIDALDVSPLLRREWEEFKARAVEAARTALGELRRLHVAAVQREDEARELAQLRAEAAERERQEAERLRIEREAEIAARAAEAARMAAEAEAGRKAREVEEAARREREAAAERERVAAEALARADLEGREAAQLAEGRRVAAHRQALDDLDAATSVVPGSSSVTIRGTLQAFLNRPAREWEEFLDEATKLNFDGQRHLQDCLRSAEEREDAENEQRRLKAEYEAKKQRAESQRRETAAAEAARKAERQRVASEQVAADAAAERRAANIAHRKLINNEALTGIVKAMSDVHSWNEADAIVIGKAIIAAIAKGDVMHISIKY